MNTSDMLKSSQYEKELGYSDTEVGKEELKQDKIRELEEVKEKQQKKIKLTAVKILKKKKKLLKKIIKKKRKKLKIKKSIALQSEIARRKLLIETVKKKNRSVAILRKIEDKITPAFSEEHSIFGDRPKKQKPTFLRIGGLI